MVGDDGSSRRWSRRSDGARSLLRYEGRWSAWLPNGLSAAVRATAGVHIGRLRCFESTLSAETATRYV